MRHPSESIATTLLSYWHVLLRRKWAVLPALAVGVILASVYNYNARPVYRSTALVLIQDNVPRFMDVQDFFMYSISAEQRYQTRLRLILSRAVLQAVAERLELHKWPEFAGVSDIPRALEGRIDVQRIERSQLARVSFQGHDRSRVAEVANAVVECYRIDSLQRRRRSSDSAADWIDGQLPRLRKAMIAVEERLQGFREEHNIVDLDPNRDIVVERLNQLNRDLMSAERERMAAEAESAVIDAAGSDPEKIEALPLVLENQALREIERRRGALREERVEFLRTMSARHRDVKAADDKLARLQSERERVIRRTLAAAQNRLAVARGREEALREALEEQQTKALALNSKIIQLDRLRREVERAKEAYEPLLERATKINLASDFDATPVQIIDRAQKPGAPIRPRKALNLALGMLLGLLAGVGIAFMIDQLDDAVRSLHELEHATRLAAIGAIPNMSGDSSTHRATICHTDPNSSAAEAYRSLRTRILLSMSDGPGRATPGGNGPTTLLVTSGANGEGKTTTAVNLAVAFAQISKRVLLVDADLRRSSIHKMLGLSGEEGLSNYLSDGEATPQVVHSPTVSGLDVVTAGPAPQRPAELLGSERMLQFLEWGKSNYDLVLFDSPPLTAVTDGLVISPHVDSVILVVLSGETPRSLAARGRELLEAAKARTVGAVLNNVRRSHLSYGYGYRYGYGYDYAYSQHGRYYRGEDEERRG